MTAEREFTTRLVTHLKDSLQHAKETQAEADARSRKLEAAIKTSALELHAAKAKMSEVEDALVAREEKFQTQLSTLKRQALETRESAAIEMIVLAGSLSATQAEAAKDRTAQQNVEKGLRGKVLVLEARLQGTLVAQAAAAKTLSELLAVAESEAVQTEAAHAARV
jgi:hypothetical protein